ncbi:hypothetical protein BC834DRAFT_114830 [Gloeopeniophorella convolvens]|nr:hypothetical protein BC834DRAFT_114830 [Gloeopeniophorella convolvens]
MPTPRESTPAEPTPRTNTHTHKLLHAVGKKLAAATAPAAPSASAPPPTTTTATKRKRAESPPAALVHKRRKTLSTVPLPSAHPRELLRKGWSRSGRKHLPSAKARETDPMQKRPRGRPRLHPLPPSTPRSTSPAPGLFSASAPPPATTTSAPPTPQQASASAPPSPSRTAKSRAVDDQPRETNGRFGKKASTNGKFRRRLGPVPALRRTRAQRAEGRARAAEGAPHSSASESGSSEGSGSSSGESADTVTAVAVKREHADEQGARKRARVQYFAPNPMSFARKKWAPAQLPPPPSHHLRSRGGLRLPPASSQSQSQSHVPPPLDNDDAGAEDPSGESDDAEWPVTPEDVRADDADADPDADADVDPDEEADDADAEAEVEAEAEAEAEAEDAPAPAPAPSLWKPSPNAYAARRWATAQQHHAHEPQYSLPGPGVRPRSTSGGSGAVARTEWMQTNGSAAMYRRWDTYEADSASGSDEEVRGPGGLNCMESSAVLTRRAGCCRAQVA